MIEFGFLAHQFDENEIEDISTMDEMNEFIFNQDDDVQDFMDDYYKYYDRMSAEECF